MVFAISFNETRGIKIPLSVAKTSNIEEGSGAVVPIPTCVYKKYDCKKIAENKTTLFIIITFYEK